MAASSSITPNLSHHRPPFTPALPGVSSSSSRAPWSRTEARSIGRNIGTGLAVNICIWSQSFEVALSIFRKLPTCAKYVCLTRIVTALKYQDYTKPPASTAIALFKEILCQQGASLEIQPSIKHSARNGYRYIPSHPLAAIVVDPEAAAVLCPVIHSILRARLSLGLNHLIQQGMPSTLRTLPQKRISLILDYLYKEEDLSIKGLIKDIDKRDSFSGRTLLSEAFYASPINYPAAELLLHLGSDPTLPMYVQEECVIKRTRREQIIVRKTRISRQSILDYGRQFAVNIQHAERLRKLNWI